MILYCCQQHYLIQVMCNMIDRSIQLKQFILFSLCLEIPRSRLKIDHKKLENGMRINSRDW